MRTSCNIMEDVFLHEIYLYNQRYYNTFYRSPIEYMAGIKPNIAHLLMFGSLIASKIPKKKKGKLDNAVYNDIFLGFGATGYKIKYMDTNSGVEKLSKQAAFDEAHYGRDSRSPVPYLLFNIWANPSLGEIEIIK